MRSRSSRQRIGRLAAGLMVVVVAGGLACPAGVAADGVAPVCTDMTASIAEDASLAGTLNCVDDLALTFAVDQPPGGVSVGTVVLDDATTGAFTFTPAANYNGGATFKFRATSADGPSNDGTMSITIDPVNDSPTGTDNTVTTLEDTPYVFVTTDFGFSDPTDSPPNSLLAVRITTAPSVGTLKDGGTTLGAGDSVPVADLNGHLLAFTPAANANGAAYASFTFQVRDNGGILNGGIDLDPSPKTMTVDVTAVNDPPSFTKGADQSISEDAGAQTVPGWATSVSPGPPDESGQVVDFIVSNDNNPLFLVQPVVSATGTLSYTPAANVNGAATVSVRIHDNGGTAGGGSNTSATRTFTITVTAVNDPPSFTKGPDQTVAEDAGAQSVGLWATAISDGPNESGQTLTFQVTGDSNSVLFSSGPAISSTGTLTYTPAANANGSATITINLKDNGGGSNTSATQTFTITVTPVNDPPSFSKGPDQTVAEDAGAQSVGLWATAISPGPADESAQTVAFEVVGDTNATLFSSGPALDSSGTLTYTSAPNANGSATITIDLKDSGGGTDTSAPASFTITVTPVNDAPVCPDTPVDVQKDRARSTQVVCTDVDGNTLTYAKVAEPTWGTVVLAPDGTFTYTPNPGYVGFDSFTYRANDGLVDSASATVNLDVVPDPYARTDLATVSQGSGANAIDVLANDVELDPGDGIVVGAIVSAPVHGVAKIVAGGASLTYDPAAYFSGVDSFRYRIVDHDGHTSEASVVVTVAKAVPVARVPAVALVSATTFGSSTVRARVSWGAVSTGVGLKKYQVQESRNGGSFKTVSIAATARSVIRTQTVGASYRYRVRIVDKAGNVGAWTAGPVLHVARYQETSGAIAWVKTWKSVKVTGSSGGRVRQGTVAGSTATFAFTGTSVAWLTTRASSRGSARVSIDGVLVKTVNLHARGTTTRYVACARSWSTSGPHTITIQVIGSAGHPRVDVDAFVVLR